MEYKGLHLHGWLKYIKDSIVPPMCVEIFLIDNRSYYLNSVVYWEDNDPIVLLRIWDIRIMNEDDIDKLKEAMNNVKHRNDYRKPRNIHEKLDWANLRVSKEYIAYVIEWHDQLWPRNEIGFKVKKEENGS